jgi:hypothetical protein
MGGLFLRPEIAMHAYPLWLRQDRGTQAYNYGALLYRQSALFPDELGTQHVFHPKHGSLYSAVAIDRCGRSRRTTENSAPLVSRQCAHGRGHDECPRAS